MFTVSVSGEGPLDSPGSVIKVKPAILEGTNKVLMRFTLHTKIFHEYELILHFICIQNCESN